MATSLVATITLAHQRVHRRRTTAIGFAESSMTEQHCDCPPAVSVVISTYNSAGLLRDCLAHLLQQSIIDECEILVIDSGSEQDEASVCAAMQADFPCLLYERTPRETIYGAWNRALAKARGRYFVNANTDDSLHPNALALFKRALDQYPEAAIAYGDWVWSEVPNASFPWDTAYRQIRHDAYHPSTALFYCYTGCNQFWRTECLRRIGGFNAQRWAAGDYEALIAVARRQWPVVHVPVPIAAFYQNPAGLSLATNRSIQEFLEIRRDIRETLTISSVFDVDDGDAKACATAWVALAQRALYIQAPWAATTQPLPDFAYATFAAERALAADPSNRPAKRMLRALVRRKRTVVDRILRKKCDGTDAIRLPKVAEPPPRVRPMVAAVD